MMEEMYWFCTGCKKRISAKEIDKSTCHTVCGAEVKWIEEKLCPACEGVGHTDDEGVGIFVCPVCHGEGWVRADQASFFEDEEPTDEDIINASAN